MRRIIGKLAPFLVALILGSLSGLLYHAIGKGVFKSVVTGVAVGAFVLVFFNTINID